MKQFFFALILLVTVGQTFSQNNAFTTNQLEQANTAGFDKALSALEKQVIQHINLVRLFPKQYFLLYADSMAKVFEIETFHAHYASLQTTLTGMQPVGIVFSSENLNKMAADLAADIGPAGIVGHTDSKKRTFQKRIELYGVKGYSAENIEFGGADALGIVFSWLFDLHTPSLGHRETLLNATYKYAGVKHGTHKTYKTCTVLDMED